MTEQTFLPASADSLARLHTAEAMGTIHDIMKGRLIEPAGQLAIRLKAAETILDRGHGRAVQAVITVPARQAIAAKLVAMTDADLMQIAKRGGGVPPEKGSPHASGNGRGSIPVPTAYAEKATAGAPLAIGHKHYSSQELQEPIDAEFEEAYDPCA